MKRIWTTGIALAVGTAALAACGGDQNATPGSMTQQSGAANGQVTLVGAGATFPYPIYSKWFDAYSRANPVRVNYQSIGSGGGIRQLTEKTVDFGASDAPMNDEELAKAPGTLHLPTVVGSVAITYNLPSVTTPLQLTGPLLGDIFLGTVKKWNDPRIQQLNPGATLPDRDILVVHRSDGSGTSFVFTEYLTAVSPAWKQAVGTGKSVDWPTGLGAKGNEGVAGQVKQTEGAIAYVEEVYATQNKLATASLRNRAGVFVQPTLAATTAAAAGVSASLPDSTDFRVSLIDPAGAGAYPISSWTYLLVPTHFDDCVRAKSLGELARWAYSAEGDAMASELGYAPLPERAEELALARWSTVTCGPDRQPALAK
jgi:phosphate transport system substrate-binding protein